MNQYVEKFAWMVIPLLLSAVTYMWSTLQATKEQVQQLSVSSELAREKLRHEVITFASANRERIAVLEEKVRKLEAEKK